MLLKITDITAYKINCFEKKAYHSRLDICAERQGDGHKDKDEQGVVPDWKNIILFLLKKNGKNEKMLTISLDSCLQH